MTSDDLVLTTEQNWAARSHRELYDAVHQGNDPGKTGELGWHWEQFGAGLGESADAINRGITATEAGWTGVSADAARAAIGKLAQWVTETGQHATELGARVQEQSRIMAAARAAMPEPVEFDWDAATGTLSGPGIASFTASAADVRAANEKARAAHEQAISVMTEMERQSRGVDATTPVFTAPFNPTTGRVEEVAPATLSVAGGQLSRTGGDTEQGSSSFGASPARSAGGTVSTSDVNQRVLAASAGMPRGPEPMGLPEPGPPGGQGGSAAAATAAGLGVGAGVGAFAARGGRRRSADTTRQSGPAVPGEFPDNTALGAAAAPSDTVRPAPAETVRPGPEERPFTPSAGGGSAAGARGSGGGFGSLRGRAAGRQRDDRDDTVELRPGMTTGATDFTHGTDSVGPNASGVVGAHQGTHAENTGMPPPGMRSGGAEDTERKTAYVQSEDIFDVPGDDLPPSVIGGRKKDPS